jgi:copper chaperone
VQAVDVVMATGAVTVTADRVIGRDEVTAALHTAGYELVG